MEPTRTIIMGAAGRDFHNFNVIYRDHPRYNVVAFTATQIPNIDGRRYPASLAGHLYPHGELQERSLCFLPALAAHGFDLLDELARRITPGNAQHHVLYL